MLTRWTAPTNNDGKAAVRMVRVQAQGTKRQKPVLPRANKRLRRFSEKCRQETDAKIKEWFQEAVLDALSIYTERNDSLLGDEDLLFRIKRDFEEWTPDLLQPKRRKWVEGVDMNFTPKYFMQPSVLNCRQIIRRIMRKPLPQDNAPDLMKEVERQIRKEYSEEEWEKLIEDYAIWPSEVPSDVSDMNKGRYIETDTYSPSEDEENTTARIRSVTVRVNHLRPKQQMEKKIYASLKSLNKYRVSVFNPYFEDDWAPLTEAEVIEAQKKEMITRTSRIKRLSGNIILPTSLLERQLVHIHLANKHGSPEADLVEAAKFEWTIPTAMERMLRGDTSWKKMVELIRLFRDNCIHCRRLPKAIKTTYSLVTKVRRPHETLRQYIEPAGLPPLVERIRKGASMLVSIDADCVGWCLLSSKGTLRERNKLALEWPGPVQITETISKNVYKNKALDGKVMEVHGSRLYFYEPSGFVPSEALRKVIVGNLKHLEVAEFGDVKYDPHLAEYVIEVRWRGFRSEDNTWEPLQTMYEDVRNTLLEHLTKKTRRPSQDKMRKRAKRALITAEHVIDRVIRRVPGCSAWRRHLDKVEMRPMVEWNHVASARGWTKKEKQELRKLVLKFGVGWYYKYQLYLPHKTKAMMKYYIQQRLGRLDLEEIGGECWDIEKARRSSELISRADFRCTRRFEDCEQALALANEEVGREFTPEYAEDLRRHRRKAADYAREVTRICKKLKQYPELIRTMILAFEEEKEADWGVSWFRVRYERHAEPTRTPMVLTNHPPEIEQSAKWRYLVSFGGKVQFTMLQKVRC
eukprot:augustus_masked-scaffold_1-processed-gene-17.50-mRNA-1 protein AED:1.00 eAED:1.00 QI:0/0/0/0/1/1/3/0/802